MRNYAINTPIVKHPKKAKETPIVQNKKKTVKKKKKK